MEEEQPHAMVWPCDGVVRSMSAERALAPVVLRRGEFGRGRDLPSHRMAEIESACARHGMSRFQALSFRRQLLRAQPGGMRRVNQSDAMGSAAGQQQVADLYERAVEAHLLAAGAPFLTQAQQQAEIRAGTRSHAPTPDILFTGPVLINGRAVRWLDCKLYYGAALLADNPKLPVGKLAAAAATYSAAHGGGGGFVFGQSFCAELCALLGPAVLLLDATPVDMRAVLAFQDAST